MNWRDRAGYIGASDQQHVLNLAPYGCARKLFFQKLLIEPDYEEPEKPVLALGTYLEAFILERYQERMRATLSPYVPRNADLPEWFAGAVDAVTEVGQRDGLGVLECKSASPHVCRRILNGDGLPDGYIAQLQHLLLSTGLKWADWAVLDRDTGELYVYGPILPNVALGQRILEASKGFWKQLTRARMVALDHDDQMATYAPLGRMDDYLEDNAPCGGCDWRIKCLKERKAYDAEVVAERVARERKAGVPTVEDEGLARLVARLKRVKEAAKKAKGMNDELTDAVKDRLKEIGHESGAVIGEDKLTAYEGKRAGSRTLRLS